MPDLTVLGWLRVVSWVSVLLWIWAFYTTIRYIAPDIRRHLKDGRREIGWISLAAVVMSVLLATGNLFLAISAQRAPMISRTDFWQLVSIFTPRLVFGLVALIIWGMGWFIWNTKES